MLKKLKKHKIITTIVCMISMLALLASVGYAIKASSLIKASPSLPSPTDYDKTNDGYQGVGPWDAPDIGILSAVKFTQSVPSYLGGIALDSAGKAWTWGDNRYGQLGNGKDFQTSTGTVADRVAYAGGIVRVPYFVDNGINIVEVAAGFYYFLALDDQGNVYTWGDNRNQQLGFVGGNKQYGESPRNSQKDPVKVAGLPPIKSINATNGYDRYMISMALAQDGSFWVWGDNSRGTHGQGGTSNTITSAYQATPHKVNFGEDITITKFVSGSLAYAPYIHLLDSDGNRWTWGTTNQGVSGVGGTSEGINNGDGQLRSPKKVLYTTTSGMGKLVDISSSYASTVALDENGKIWMWGVQYGTGTGTGSNTQYQKPVQVGINTAEIGKVGYTPIPKSISAGESVNYFIDQYGRSWAWGSGRYFGFGREGGYEDSNDQIEKEAVQYPKVIGDGDTQIYDRSPKDPAEGIRAGAYGVYSTVNQLHPTIYDEKYTDPKEDKWKNLAFSPIPKLKNIYGSRSSYMIIDENGNLFRWGNDGSGSIAWGWDYNSKYDQNGNVLNGLYDRYTYEVMWMRGSPSIDNIGLNIKSTPKKIYKSTGKETPVKVEASFPASFHDANMNFDMQAILKDLKYVYLPYDGNDPDFNKTSMSQAEFLDLYSRTADADKGDLVDTPIASEDQPKKVEFDLPTAKENGKVWVMIEDEAYGRTSYTFQSYKFDNFYTDTKLDNQGLYFDDKTTEVYAETDTNVEKLTQDGIDRLLGFPLDVNGKIIGTPTAPPTFGYDEAKVTKLTADQLAGIDPNLNKYWLWHTPQADSKTFKLNGVDAPNADDITKTTGELAVSDKYTHKFYYDENPDAYVKLHYIGVDKNGDQIPEFNMTPNPEKLKKEVEYTRTPPKLSAASGYKAKSYKVVHTAPPTDPVNISGETELEKNGDVKFTIPWGNEIKDATVIIIYEQAPLAHFISADRGVAPYVNVTGFVNEAIRTPIETEFTHDPNDATIDSEYKVVGYKIFDGKLTSVSSLNLTNAVKPLKNGKAVYLPPADQEEYTVVYIYEKDPLVHYKAVDVGATANNILTDFSMTSERLLKDQEKVKTPTYSNEDYVAIGYKIVDNKIADGTTNIDSTGYVTSQDGTASFTPQDHGYEFTVVFIYEKRTIVNFVGIDAQDENSLTFMGNWDMSSTKEVKGTEHSKVPKDYTVPDGYKVMGYYVVNGKVTDPTTVDLSKAKPLINGAGDYKVPSDQDEITVIFVYDIPPTIGILHVRQVIIGGNSKVSSPKNGYMKLSEAKPGSSWTYGTKQLNISTVSGLETATVAYSDYELPISKEYMGYGLKWTTPQYYSYLGYKISSDNGNYDSSGMNTSKEIQIDFTDKNEYWVTIYLKPFTDKPGNFSWSDAINKFGEFLIK